MSIASALVSISFIVLHFVGVPHLLPNLLEASHARRNLRRVRDETSRGFDRERRSFHSRSHLAIFFVVLANVDQNFPFVLAHRAPSRVRHLAHQLLLARRLARLDGARHFIDVRVEHPPLRRRQRNPFLPRLVRSLATGLIVLANVNERRFLPLSHRHALRLRQRHDFVLHRVVAARARRRVRRRRVRRRARRPRALRRRRLARTDPRVRHEPPRRPALAVFSPRRSARRHRVQRLVHRRLVALQKARQRLRLRPVLSDRLQRRQHSRFIQRALFRRRARPLIPSDRRRPLVVDAFALRRRRRRRPARAVLVRRHRRVRAPQERVDLVLHDDSIDVSPVVAARRAQGVAHGLAHRAFGRAL